MYCIREEPIFNYALPLLILPTFSHTLVLSKCQVPSGPFLPISLHLGANYFKHYFLGDFRGQVIQISILIPIILSHSAPLFLHGI